MYVQFLKNIEGEPIESPKVLKCDLMENHDIGAKMKNQDISAKYLAF